MKKIIALMAVTVLAFTANAEEKGWSFELTPYAWLAGIDADVTAGPHTAKVDAGFDDLVDKVDMAGSILAIAQYNRIVMYGQFDYVGMSEDGKLPGGGDVGVESDMTIATAAIGYQLDGFCEGSTFDLLVGARYAGVENSLDSPLVDVKGDTDIWDAVFMLRPSVKLSDNWRLNPAMGIGAGDSDLTWELHPQVQYAINDSMALRLGYRRVYFDYDGNGKAAFDGSLHGLTLGLGAKF